MNKQIARYSKVPRLALVLFVLLLAGCGSRHRVGELRTESRSVELGSEESVNVKFNFGAGDLKVSGGAEKLLEAGFTYNVDELKPEVKYTGGTLIIQQPDAEGLPKLTNITDFRNEWDLSLNNDVPMNLSVDMVAGNSDLQLSGLSLTGLDVTLGAGTSAIDLGGAWAKDLNVHIDTGAATITVILPKDVGVRVQIEAGPHTIEAPGLTQDGNTYTNSAYGVSDVTLQITIQAGVGTINLEVEE